MSEVVHTYVGRRRIGRDVGGVATGSGYSSSGVWPLPLEIRLGRWLDSQPRRHWIVGEDNRKIVTQRVHCRMGTLSMETLSVQFSSLRSGDMFHFVSLLLFFSCLSLEMLTFSMEEKKQMIFIYHEKTCLIHLFTLHDNLTLLLPGNRGLVKSWSIAQKHYWYDTYKDEHTSDVKTNKAIQQPKSENSSYCLLLSLLSLSPNAVHTVLEALVYVLWSSLHLIWSCKKSKVQSRIFQITDLFKEMHRTKQNKMKIRLPLR